MIVQKQYVGTYLAGAVEPCSVGVVTRMTDKDKPRGRHLKKQRSLPFSWGKAPGSGSGPFGAHLALAILVDALGETTEAIRLHQRFKFRVVVELEPQKSWVLTVEQVLATVDEIRAVETDKGIRENVKKASQEPRPVEHEGGRGVVAGSRVVWDTNSKGEKIFHHEDE